MANIDKKNGSSSITNISSIDHFERAVLKSDKPAIIDFWAPWCGPCRMVAPVFEELSEQYKDEITFVKVNTQDRPEVAQLFGIRSIPTMIVIKGEEVKDVFIGAAPRPTLEKFILRAIGKDAGLGFTDKLKSLFGVQAEKK